MEKFNILNQPLQKLTSVDLSILSKINTYPQEVIGLSISDLAHFCYTSIATISRFIRKFGFTNYKDFMIHINHIYQLSKLNFENKKQRTHIFNTIVASSKYAIENILAPTDYQKVQDVAKLVARVNKVALFGIGSSFNVCCDLYSNLWKINKPTFINSDFHVFLAALSNWKPTDLIILFSNRAISRELTYVVNYCYFNKIPTVLVTSNNQYRHSHKVTYQIIHANIIQSCRVSASSSKISQSLIADLLFRMIVFASKRYQIYFANVQQNINQWSK